METVKKTIDTTVEQDKLLQFIKDNKLTHIVWDVYLSTKKETGEVIGSFAYCKVITKDWDPLLLKYFGKYDNIIFQNWENTHSQYLKDQEWVINKVFEATIKKLKISKPVNDLAMF